MTSPETVLVALDRVGTPLCKLAADYIRQLQEECRILRAELEHRNPPEATPTKRATK